MQIVELKSCELKKLLVIIALLPASMLFVGMAMGAPTNVSSCQAITSPGEYVLNQSIMNSTASSCINITSSDVVFDGAGYTIDGINASTTTGVNVYNSTVLTNVTVKNLTVTDWSVGIYYINTYDGSIENNTLSSNENEGIHLKNSNNNTLSNNTANSNSIGIALGSSNNNTLNNNIIILNTNYGIFLFSSSNNNTLTSNNASWNGEGIRLYDSSNNNTLTTNVINYNTNGISSWSSNYNSLSNNTVSSNSVTGIFFSSSSNNTINNNTANSNTAYGIYFYNSSDNTLSNNAASLNDVTGIYTLSSRKNTFMNNNASSNTKYGIYLDASSNTTLTNNTASSNTDGIALFLSSNSNILSNNTASSNINTGISIDVSSNNSLNGNNMTGNGYNFHLSGSQESDFNNSIETSNLIDGKHIFYVKNVSDTIYNGSTNTGTFYCFFCNNVTIKDLTFTKNGFGVFFWNTTNSKLENITASLNANSGIRLENSNNNILTSSNSSTNNYYGISLVNSSNNTLSNNTANSNSDGFYLDFSSDNTLTNNTANSNTYGIGLTTSSNNNTLANNIANSNSDIGLIIKHSSNNSVSNNTVSLNLHGVFFDSAVSNTFSNNTANFNLYGISLANSSSNALTDNSALYNALWDFYSISGSVNNTVTTVSINPTISFTGKDIAIKSVSSPAVAPTGYSGIGIYVNATNNSADSWLFLNVSYTESDIADMNENTLSMWKYNSSWSQVPGANGVEASQNYVYANITSFSTFAPLGADTTPPSVTNLAVTPSSPQVGGSTNITVKISDDNLNTSNLFVTVKHPGGFTNTSLMNGTSGAYFYNYTNTSEYGRYNVTISASDITGNVNDTENTWFITLKNYSSYLKVHSDGNGTVTSGSMHWNVTNFPGLVHEENLYVQDISDGIIQQNSLWYNTTRKMIQYKVNENNSTKLVEYAFDPEGIKQSTPGGGWYYKIGWQGISYVALNGTTNKTAMLLVEQGNFTSDKKTLSVGESWDMGDGYSLTAMSIDAKASPRQVWLELSKRGVLLDDKVVAQGEVYTFSLSSLAGESDVPIFVTYVDSVFAGATSDMMQLRYTWLISDNVTNITTGEVFGNLTVVQSNDTAINLTNTNNITISRNSTTNLMDSLYFRDRGNASLEYYPFFQTPTQANASDTDVVLEILTNTGLPGIIEINKMVDTPPGINRTHGLTPFGKYISINSTSNLIDNLSWVLIKIYYTDDELKSSGLDENSLKIEWRGGDTDVWETLAKGSPSWVNDAGLNTNSIDGYSGFVWVNVSHFSYYGLVGEVSSTQTPTSPGGGGGGGGGGSSGENYTNIESKEKYDLHIFKDNVTSYRFVSSDPILFVNITGNINAGEITALVEVLRKTSSLVKTPAPGIVYKNVNIWIGTSGFAVPKNIKEALIKFRVKNSWMAETNIQEHEVFLLNWDGASWNKLETRVAGRDDKYTYFESKADTFPNFAISAIKGTAIATSIPIPTTRIETAAETPAPVTASQPVENMEWAFALIGFIGSATAGYYFVNKKREYRQR